MNLFQGAIDFHIHGSPSLYDRALTDHELAIEAVKAGMAGIALKAHEGSTVERAILVQEKNKSLQVAGGLVLNSCVGGLNPIAVETSLKLGAKIIWMPTMSARNHFTNISYRDNDIPFLAKNPEEGITVLDAGGKLFKEARQIMEIVGEYDAALATGHLAYDEVYSLAKYAKKIGFKKLVFNHPDIRAFPASLDKQLSLAKMGVYFEKCYRSILFPPKDFNLKKMAEDIEKVGFAQCLLATDLGQADCIKPALGLEYFISSLQSYGFNHEKIKKMVSHNPRHLLNL